MARGGIKLTGSGLKKLRALELRLGDISTVKRSIAAVQAEEAIDLTKVGFNEQTDPYGKRWKKRKRETKKTRGRKVLSGPSPGRLKNSWHVDEVSPTGFTVSTSVNYALPHQRPRKGRRPQRAMVPLTGRFPKKWKRPMNDAASDAVTDFLTGK